MQTSEYAEANRISWNTAAPLHAQKRGQELLEAFAQPGYSRLTEFETARVQSLGLHGADVVQAPCNNGRELLSLKNLGAARCVGFDISDAFIEEAWGLAAAGGIEAEFVRSSVYDIPHDYDQSFDLFYVTIGSLGWMPDLNEYFAVVARLLRPGGHIFIYEMHPILDMFEGLPIAAEEPLKIRHSYFRNDPFVDLGGIDYLSGVAYESPPSYWFHHKMSDVIGGLLRNGLAITSFEELPEDRSMVFAHLEPLAVKPPLSYLLVGEKRG